MVKLMGRRTELAMDRPRREDAVQASSIHECRQPAAVQRAPWSHDPVQCLRGLPPRRPAERACGVVSTDDKVQLIGSTWWPPGYKDIEVTSFVRPTWIPQLADAAQVGPRSSPPWRDVRYWALIPNRRGLERALDVGIRARRHLHERLRDPQQEEPQPHPAGEPGRPAEEVIGDRARTRASDRARLHLHGVRLPLRGRRDRPPTARAGGRAPRDAGADTIALGDTTGMGNPAQVQQVRRHMAHAGGGSSAGSPSPCTCTTPGAPRWPTYLAGYQAGHPHLRRLHRRGRCGCPYAPGASGNASTEDLIHRASRRWASHRRGPRPPCPEAGVMLARRRSAGSSPGATTATTWAAAPPARKALRNGHAPR